LGQKPIRKRGGVEAQLHELVVLDDQVVLRSFLARVRQVSDLSAGELGDHLGQIANPMGLRHLVKDFYAVATLGSVLECNFNTANGILDVDEGAGLTTRAVYGKRITNGRLDEETVQHRAVIAVIIEAVDELLVK